MSSAPIPSLLDARRRAHAAERAPDSRVPEQDRVPEYGPTGPTARARSAHEGGASHVLSLVALQRSAGNAAVTALLAAKARPGGTDKVAEIDAALREARKGEPDLVPLERGLKVAKDVGVQVDIDGAEQKPPASALAVTKTGFGPATVAGKKPVPPPKPTAAVSPLAKAARPAPKPKAGGPGGTARPIAGLGASAKTGALPAGGPVNLLEPPAPPTRTRPEDDPAFTAVTGAVAGYAKAKRAHPPPASKAKEAQDAALAPADDVQSQAKAAKVDTMDAQPAGSFDKKAFIAAVKAAIEAKSPKNLQEADKYKDSGKAGQVKDEVKGLVSGNKRQSAEAIETATQAPPDAAKAVAKPVAPLQQEDPGPTGAIPATGAVPKPAPAEQLNLAAGKHEANQELADAEVTEGQLAKSNEPEFTGALEAKHEAAQHADAGPAQFRQEEAATLAQSRAQANDSTQGAVTDIHGAKAAALAQVTGSKAATKSQDEAKRAEVSAKVQSIFSATEADVKKILDGIDPKVEKAFEQGEKEARAAFEGLVAAKMSAYKKDRYGGWLGGYRWLKDKLIGMPSTVNEFFVAGRELYLKEMDRVISNVADIVGADLKAAKDRIAKGKSEIAAYVKTLPTDLQKVGADAAKEVSAQFGKLESDVASKQEAVVDTLATKYVESRKGLDDRIEALQAENKGLVDKAIGALKDVVQTILKLKDMLLNVLARAVGAIGKIIKDPIGFLGNFVNAVKTGIVNFGTNILDHLKKGLQKWLFGALSEGGIELPDKFDLKGVVTLVLSILGMTWQRVRARIVAKIGAPAMDFVEKGLDIVKTILAEGLGGMWKWVLEKVGDLKAMVMAQVEEMVATQIIKAGITWLISMLNPAGAFIKACKMIYDVVMFFVEKAAQIKEFVDAVLDSVEAIAAGGVGAVASKIEDALGKLVPILIGFLASLLGLGGIADKIKKIIETIQKPVMKVVDWVVGKAVAFGKKFMGVAKKVGGKLKAGAKKLGAKVKKKLGIKENSPGAVRAEALRAVRTRLQHVKDMREAGSALSRIQSELAPRGLKGLTLGPSDRDGAMAIVATASPPTRIAKLAPWASAQMRKAQVKALVKVDFTEPPDLSGVRWDREAVKGPDGVVLVGSDGKPVMRETNLGSAGAARVKRPDPGSNVVEIVSASGSTLRNWRNNVSHAEFHATGVLGDRGQVRGKVASVTVKLEGKSPCPNCVRSLQNARTHVRALSPGATFALDCSGTVLYDPDRAGNFKTWAELRAAMGGWAMTEGKPVNVPPDPFRVI